MSDEPAPGESAPTELRFFISSPGDVTDHRVITQQTIERLRFDQSIASSARLVTVSWDTNDDGPAFDATVTPQASIDAGLPKPSECDVVIVIFWSRMGTPLPFPEYQKPDGTPFRSGTEWEFWDAVNNRRDGDLPRVLVYRSTEPVLIDVDDEHLEDRREQRRRVQEFFAGFVDAETGALRRGTNEFVTTDDFRKRLDHDLRSVIKQLLSDRSAGSARAASDRSAPAPWVGSPFPGLRAFTPSDAPIFFGRDRETDDVVRLVRTNRFVIVTGASGSGKSSLVGAGVIPRLARLAEESRRAGWLLPTHGQDSSGWRRRFTPGEAGGDPLWALANQLVDGRPDDARVAADRLRSDPDHISVLGEAALARHRVGPDGTGPDELLLFVDQFEELFTQVDEADRAPLIAVLGAAARSETVRVIATLRSDFYRRCLERADLARLMERGQFPLPAPTDTLHEMIVGPAARANLTVEAGLAGRMVLNTGTDAGSLPLLAYTLDELDRRCRAIRRLTLAVYEQIGGVRGAIATRAEHAFDELVDDEARDAFDQVFGRLIDVDDSGAVARRRAATSEVVVSPATAQLVDVFTEARLITAAQGETGEPEAVLEIAHEALFSAWERLRTWVEARHDAMVTLRRVTTAAHEWDRLGRDDGYLWPHERLLGAYEMIELLQPSLDDVTAEFIRPESERLVERFVDPDLERYQRQGVADRLVAIGAASIPSLIGALDASDVVVRTAAATTLARLGARAVPALSEAVRSGSHEVRLLALGALAPIVDVRAVDALSEAFRDPDREVSSLAAGLLRTVGGEAAAAVVDEAMASLDLDRRWLAVGALGGLGEHAAPGIVAGLLDPDPGIRAETLGAIAVAGEAAIPALAEMLSDQPERALAAADALVAVGTPAVPGLVRAVAHREAATRLLAVDALMVIGDRTAAPAIGRCLRDPSLDVRRSASEALRRLPHPDSVADLVAALGDVDGVVSTNSVVALGAIGSPSVPALVDLIHDPPNERARELAAIALGGVGGAAVAPIVSVLYGRDPLVRHWLMVSLGRTGSASVDTLVGLVVGDDVELSVAATTAISTIDEQAVAALLSAIGDQPVDVRRRLAQAVGAIPSMLVDRRLVDLLVGDDDATVRAAAAEALGGRNGAGLPELLESLLREDEPVRGAAARALAAIGGLAVPGLVSVAGLGDGEVAARSVAALDEIGTTAALLEATELRSKIGGT